jgi:hypothetical protein
MGDKTDLNKYADLIFKNILADTADDEFMKIFKINKTAVSRLKNIKPSTINNHLMHFDFENIVDELMHKKMSFLVSKYKISRRTLYEWRVRFGEDKKGFILALFIWIGLKKGLDQHILKSNCEYKEKKRRRGSFDIRKKKRILNELEIFIEPLKVLEEHPTHGYAQLFGLHDLDNCNYKIWEAHSVKKLSRRVIAERFKIKPGKRLNRDAVTFKRINQYKRLIEDKVSKERLVDAKFKEAKKPQKLFLYGYRFNALKRNGIKDESDIKKILCFIFDSLPHEIEDLYFLYKAKESFEMEKEAA